MKLWSRVNFNPVAPSFLTSTSLSQNAFYAVMKWSAAAEYHRLPVGAIYNLCGDRRYLGQQATPAFSNNRWNCSIFSHSAQFFISGDKFGRVADISSMYNWLHFVFSAAWCRPLAGILLAIPHLFVLVSSVCDIKLQQLISFTCRYWN